LSTKILKKILKKSKIRGKFGAGQPSCRMLGNDGLDREEIIRTHREATIRRMPEYGGPILAVEDITGVNYLNWVNETLHPAGIPGVPRMNLWVKFSPGLRGFPRFALLHGQAYPRSPAMLPFHQPEPGNLYPENCHYRDQ
jgi:hypothetical protein